jgi:methyltransferase family protein
MIAYDAEFYLNQKRGSLRSAEQVLPIIFDAVRPRSIVDVGCGIGTWLAVARSLGVSDYRGYEGAWVQGQVLADPGLVVVAADLESPLPRDRVFDLAICLEVGEHLSEGRADSLVDDLCFFSEHVLFGAATPGQVGTNHINLQWQSYWADKFLRRGYLPFDLVRPKVWGSVDVECWYQQNILLYSKNASVLPTGSSPTKMLDLIHPEIFRWQTGVRLSMTNLCKAIKMMVIRER